jgi:hypothetical protein
VRVFFVVECDHFHAHGKRRGEEVRVNSYKLCGIRWTRIVPQ